MLLSIFTINTSGLNYKLYRLFFCLYYLHFFVRNVQYQKIDEVFELESRKMSKFLSYAKKFLAMLSFSLVVSISLFSEDVLAIDPAKVTINSNGITYVDSYQPRVSYELSADNKSFSAIVEDEGTVVYSQVICNQYGTDIATLPVTSISAAKGVSDFTLNIVDTKNDKVKIEPSEYGDLTVKLSYNGSLSKSEAKKNI